MTKVTRPEEPAHRVTVQNIIDWQQIRAQQDEKALVPVHMINHIFKAGGEVGRIIDCIEHGLPIGEVDDKRLADFIISAVWAVKAAGFDPAGLVAKRIWSIGIGPKDDELPPGERE